MTLTWPTRYARMISRTLNISNFGELSYQRFPECESAQNGAKLRELSRTMVYITRKKVNRLACKQLHLNHVPDQRRNKPTHRAREA